MRARALLYREGVEVTYKDVIRTAMEELARHEETCFVGYNLCKAGGSAGGSVATVDETKIFECPLAENLMTGIAIGLSLQGRIPILFFERSDFVLCATDAICNHLNALAELSEGVHRPACIIRVVVGNSKTPLFTGKVHSQDLSYAMREMVQFPVVRLTDKRLIEPEYRNALHRAKKHRTSTMLFEFKDAYNS